MDPELYRNYVLSLNHDNSNGFDTSLLSMQNKNEMLFTIKNYARQDGLSEKLHRLPQRSLLYEVKGPMGKGLQV
jgi:hypothetical protein